LINGCEWVLPAEDFSAEWCRRPIGKDLLRFLIAGGEAPIRVPDYESCANEAVIFQPLFPCTYKIHKYG
jgi:hypothetical protein